MYWTLSLWHQKSLNSNTVSKANALWHFQLVHLCMCVLRVTCEHKFSQQQHCKFGVIECHHLSILCSAGSTLPPLCWSCFHTDVQHKWMTSFFFSLRVGINGVHVFVLWKASAGTVWEGEAERGKGREGIIVWELVMSSLSNNCCN